jgi:hypothetical protein
MTVQTEAQAQRVKDFMNYDYGANGRVYSRV